MGLRVHGKESVLLYVFHLVLVCQPETTRHFLQEPNRCYGNALETKELSGSE